MITDPAIDATATWVRRYYSTVDRGRPADIVRLFSPECQYLRPGFAPLNGIEEVLAFYRGARPIREGRHRIEAVITESSRAAAHGTFAGTLRNGAGVDVSFADFFEFDPDSLIRRRKTFFYLPAV